MGFESGVESGEGQCMGNGGRENLLNSDGVNWEFVEYGIYERERKRWSVGGK